MPVHDYSYEQKIHIVFPRTRMSVRELELPSNKYQRYATLKAFHKIKNLPSENKLSFWSIASINGQPFNKLRTVPPQSEKVWGGYSQHENVLFLPWYRAYLLYFENALIDAAPDSEKSLVAVPYWDATATETLAEGFPDLLMDHFVTIDDNGNTISNPLLDYVLPEAIPPPESNPKYVRSNGYTTLRYPFSGLTGSIQSDSESKLQNDYLNWQDFRDSRVYLQENVLYSLTVPTPSIKYLFENSLKTRKYNAFSNELSAELKYNNQSSLETASIQILKVLGGGSQFDLLAGANGDLSSNEMAAFDPFFFLHMANIDRVFWIWQNKFKMTTPKRFKFNPINDKDKGIRTKYGQGPSPNQNGEEILTTNSKLFPFTNYQSPSEMVKVKDIIDIENQLKYTYTSGSLLKVRKWQIGRF